MLKLVPFSGNAIFANYQSFNLCELDRLSEIASQEKC